MQVSEDDQFQLIDSHYQLTDAPNIQHEPQHRPLPIYHATIKPTKVEVDLSIMENQYYQLEVKKRGAPYCTLQRRFSDFQLIFEILWRKEGGYIFPAFPQNGIFAFMKSKVVISKDEQFVNRRTKTIERFLNIVMNDQLFDPQHCREFKQFLSAGRQFQARKQIQKSSKGMFGFSWSKLKNYFTTVKENKYSDKQQKLLKTKNALESLYNKCRTLIDCLREEFMQNERFLMIGQSSQQLQTYREMIQKHDSLQKENLRRLEQLQFEMFCQNEDLHMCDKIFDRINQLKDNEDNYIELKAIQTRFQARIDNFIADKTNSTQLHQEALKKLVMQLKRVGRISK